MLQDNIWNWFTGPYPTDNKNPAWFYYLVVVFFIGMVVGGVYFGKFLRTRNDRTKYAIVLGIAIGAYIIRLALSVGIMITDEDPRVGNIHPSWYQILYCVFPMEWCAFVIAAMLILVIFKKMDWIIFIIPIAFIGAIINLLSPSTVNYWSYKGYCFYGYYLSHTLQVFLPLAIFVSYSAKFNIKQCVIGFSFDIIWTIIFSVISWIPNVAKVIGLREPYLIGKHAFTGTLAPLPIWLKSDENNFGIWMVNVLMLLVIYVILYFGIWALLNLFKYKFKWKDCKQTYKWDKRRI